MNKKKSLLLTVGLVGLILGSTLLYNVLAKSFEEDNNEEAIVAVEEQAVVEDNQAPETSTEQIETQETTDVVAEEETTAADDELTLMGSETVTEPSAVPTTAPAGEPTTKPTQNVTTAPTQGAINSTQNNTAEPTTAPTKAPVNTVVPTKAPIATPAPTATPVPTKVPANVNTAPNFTVQTYSGSNVSLSSNFGKPIVINFWASWCGPCKSEMPDFNAVYQEYKDKVVFMMVDMVDGSRETKSSGYSYVTGQGFTFPVYYDVNQSAAYAYGINSYPTTYFIDANGNVSTYSKGAMSASTLRSQLNKLINQ